MCMRMLFFGGTMKKQNYFDKKELFLLIISILIIFLSFIIFDKKNYLILIASLIGIISLIFNAKANPIGQLLMVIFSIIYGIISYQFSYYGEMVTYLGMTLPMSIFAFISWFKNPYSKNKIEVKVNTISKLEIIFMLILSIIVTIIFYFILVYFKTANIIFSTISITTSFIATYLTFRRSSYYAIAYALNDIVLIILWILASFINKSYISVVVCFVIFFINDIYGFICWNAMKKRQNNNIE